MLAYPSAAERDGNFRAGACRRLRSWLVRRWLLLLVFLGAMAGAAVWIRPHALAWHHRRAARLELQRYHNTQAIRHLLICRAIWPRDPETLLLAARGARRVQVYGDCERLLRIYREVRGRDEAYVLEQLLLAAECRIDEVSEQCGKYVQEGRFDAALLMEAMARGYMRQYRLGQARFCLDHWKEMQPDNPEAYNLEGCLLLDYLHVSSGAVDCYRRAVELDADHDEARLGLAIALLDCKEFAEAAEHFERLLRCSPQNVRVQIGVAECREGLGETEEATRLLDDVLTRQPLFAAALSLRGQLALKRGQWLEAENCLRQALRGNPLDHRARYGLIRCLEQTGQDEQARHQRHQLEQREEDVARFHEIVTKDIAQRPTDPSLHYSLGQLLLRSGQREEGVRWLQSALHLDPHYAPAHEALTQCLGQSKNTTHTSSP
jgi:tetratricopeptide (TPR) repeat protein